MKSSFFVNNRHLLATKTRGGVVVLSAYSQMQRGNDAAFAFEQEANFWWLCGIEVADWMVIIDGTRDKTWLVAPSISQSHQIFDGSLPNGDALEISGADSVLSSDEATSLLRELATKHSVVHTLGDTPGVEYFDFVVNPAQRKLHQMLQRIFKDVRDCGPELRSLRAIKQPEEINAIKKAIKLTSTAFDDVKVLLPELKSEYEVEAEFSYAFRRAGASGHAYDPIVAAGKNACTLHYNQNSQVIKKGQLVLIDIGARLNGYAADITRTYATGQPTKRQAAVHLAVETAHHNIIQLLGPEVSVKDYFNQVDQIMKSALEQLGLLTSDDSYRRYFPHSISHGLGIDVHDSLGRPDVFKPGMVLTVEPGVYIPEEGIGVRIEDDILITEKGRQNLSKALPTRL